MADTGYNWGQWAFVQESSSNWDADLLADNATDIGDAFSLSGKAACIIGIAAYENDTGAIDGPVTVFVLGENDIAYEETTIGVPFNFQFTPVQNDTVHLQFSIDPAHYDNAKIAVFNESGQELAISVKIKTATIPPAS